MKMRTRDLLAIAGSVLALASLGAWRSLPAEPDSHAAPKTTAKAKAPAKQPKQDPSKHDSAKHDESEFADEHEDTAGEPHADQTDAHEDPHSEGTHTPASPRTSAKAAAKADGKSDGARKPLFPDKLAKEGDAGADADGVFTADLAIDMLKEGNQRWASGDTKSPNADSARRMLTADKGQKPFATVLTCADSRLPVERIFDRGVGEVFTVRVAGNIAGGSEIGTIEYAVEHLHTPLLVVMGHTKCGAVAAAASGGPPLHGMLGQLVASIAPAVQRVRTANPGADEPTLAALAVKENVWQSIFDIYKTSDELRRQTREGNVRVIGAIYDIATGKVEWLGEHPWQSQILDALATKTASAEGHEP